MEMQFFVSERAHGTMGMIAGRSMDSHCWEDEPSYTYQFIGGELLCQAWLGNEVVSEG